MYSKLYQSEELLIARGAAQSYFWSRKSCDEMKNPPIAAEHSMAVWNMSIYTREINYFYYWEANNEIDASIKKIELKFPERNFRRCSRPKFVIQHNCNLQIMQMSLASDGGPCERKYLLNRTISDRILIASFDVWSTISPSSRKRWISTGRWEAKHGAGPPSLCASWNKRRSSVSPPVMTSIIIWLIKVILYIL